MDSIMDNEILCAANNTLAAMVKSLREENAQLKLELKGVRGTQAKAIEALQSEREKVKRLEKELEKHK